jgi:hypothetical protein
MKSWQISPSSLEEDSWQRLPVLNAVVVGAVYGHSDGLEETLSCALVTREQGWADEPVDPSQ